LLQGNYIASHPSLSPAQLTSQPTPARSGLEYVDKSGASHPAVPSWTFVAADGVEMPLEEGTSAFITARHARARARVRHAPARCGITQPQARACLLSAPTAHRRHPYPPTPPLSRQRAQMNPGYIGAPPVDTD
jgi:hypothetical protein